MGKYKVKVLRDKCIGAASCVAIAAKVFQLDKENSESKALKATVISQGGNTDDEKLLAAQSCPTAAIVVIDEETGEQIWPRKAR